MAPKFSIIVPVYGVEKYLPSCVDSILCQSHSDFEVFLVNDGSPDNSGQICDAYAARDSRVHVIHQSNAGAAAARNTALRLATGDYVCFVDGDDCLLGTTALSDVARALDEHSPDLLVVGHVKYWDNEDVPQPSPARLKEAHDVDWMLAHQAFTNAPWDKIARRSLISKFGLTFPEDLRTSDDAVFTSTLLIATSAIIYVPIEYYGYRQRAGSITASISPTKLTDLHRIFTAARTQIDALTPGPTRTAYGAYFARYYSFLLAATAQQKSAENFAFLRANRWPLEFARGRRARMTRMGVRVLGIRASVTIAAAAQRYHHRRRAHGGSAL